MAEHLLRFQTLAFAHFLTSDRNIKKSILGSYCIILTLSGLVAVYVGSRSLISGTSSTFFAA